MCVHYCTKQLKINAHVQEEKNKFKIYIPILSSNELLDLCLSINLLPW